MGVGVIFSLGVVCGKGVIISEVQGREEENVCKGFY